MAIPMPEPAPVDAPAIGVIVGPTASGKSSLAADVAERIGAEIVSADSQQVYQCFDAGTAKPSADEMRRVRHHLVSAVPPRAEMNAAKYAELAAQAIEGIVARRGLPLVVGGTGLYIRALLLGVVPLPPADAEVRRRLTEELRVRGAAGLRDRLREADPRTAHAIPEGDEGRLVRALEILEATGEPPSAVRARHGFARFRYRATVLGVAPPRGELYERINRRTRAMFDAGLVDEVRALSAQGFADAPPMRSLGYRHAHAHLRGELSLEAAVTGASRDTRHYAKRQLTWFHAEPWVQWVAWPPDIEGIARQLQPLSCSPGRFVVRGP